MTPALNKPLPEFEALATGGVKFTPVAYAGKIVVLYFYPKDNTPGCTTEAMQFRDSHQEFVNAGAVVFGVSRDNMASHDKFKQSLELPYDLIADTEEKLCHMFGVVKNKIMYGKKVKGIERSTFLIDARIGVETMDTAAACRTYNVLLAEGRAVVAALIFESAVDRHD